MRPNIFKQVKNLAPLSNRCSLPTSLRQANPSSCDSAYRQYKWTLPGGKRRSRIRIEAAPSPATDVEPIAAPQSWLCTAKEMTNDSRKLINAVIKQRISHMMKTGIRFFYGSLEINMCWTPWICKETCVFMVLQQMPNAASAKFLQPSAKKCAGSLEPMQEG